VASKDTTPTVGLAASLDTLKIGLTDEQVALRKARYGRQKFVPPGILWQGVMLSDAVDGKIAVELGLPFETREIALADEEDARLWVLERALETPEINAFQKIRRHLQRKDLLLNQGRERMAAGGKGLSQMTDLPSHDTRAEIAKASGVSKTQVFKTQYLVENGDSALLAQLEAGEIKIGAAYEALHSPPPPLDETTPFNLVYLDVSANMDTKQLRALPVRRLAAEDAALFCRVHPCDLAKVLGCLRGWGFAYRTHFVVPLSRPSIYDFAQEHHDLLILATQGQVPTPAVEDCPSSLLTANASEELLWEVVFGVMEHLFPLATRVRIGPGPSRPNWVAWAPRHGTPPSAA